MTAPRTAGKLVLPVLALSQIAASLMVLAPTTASAHGSMSFPVSREVACQLQGDAWSNPKFKNCGPAAMAASDWTANAQAASDGKHRELVPNGRLCAGGKTNAHWAALDNGEAQHWPTATLITPGADGKATFKYAQSAPHDTKYFKTYISKDSYVPANGLRWEDLELIGEAGYSKAPSKKPGDSLASHTVAYTDLQVTIPAWAKGKRVVYNVWQRDPNDNNEAFYACSDVEIASANTQWQHSGVVNKSNVVLNSGMKVTMRVFDRARGSDIARHEIIVAAGQQQPDKWVYALAQKVNQESSIIKVGKLVNNQVQPLESATENAVYGLNKAYNFEIETSMGEIKPPPTGEIAPGQVTISGPASVNSGANVSLNARAASGSNLKYLWEVTPKIAGLALDTAALNFKAPTLKQDTVYNFQVKVSNSKGTQSAKHALVVKADDSGTTPPVEGSWDAAKTYDKECAKVSHNGKQWMNGWWTKGDVPGTGGQWAVWRAVGSPDMHHQCKGK